MALSEAIHYFEKEAEGYENIIKLTNDGLIHDTDINKCKEHIAENRQLAEWLKELKAYREAKEEIKQYGSVCMQYGDNMSKDEIAQKALKSSKACILSIIDSYLAEVKADDSSGTD